MNYFSNIIKHYITLALDRAGVPVDSDTIAELQGAMIDLDRHIKSLIKESITLLEENDCCLRAPDPDLLDACKSAKEWYRHFLHYADHPALGHPNVEKLEADLIMLSTTIEVAKARGDIQ